MFFVHINLHQREENASWETKPMITVFLPPGEWHDSYVSDSSSWGGKQFLGPPESTNTQNLSPSSALECGLERKGEKVFVESKESKNMLLSAGSGKN